MKTEWIAVDWGTSNLRAWVFDAHGEIIAQESSSDGMARLAPEEFEAALVTLVAAHLPDSGRIPIICCGMVGARQGWREAAYAVVPCAAPSAANAIKVATSDSRIDVRILPGLMQPSPADVMRGEETQIGGLLASRPGFDGVVCLPGTHSKWARVGNGQILDFRTYMTGEVFALLAGQSVLRHSLNGDGWDNPAFLDGVNTAIASPQDILSLLFSLRAQTLVNATAPTILRARLSGLLLGMELAGARDYWQGNTVALVGDAALSEHYAAALATQDVVAYREDGDAMTRTGLARSYADLRET